MKLVAQKHDGLGIAIDKLKFGILFNLQKMYPTKKNLSCLSSWYFMDTYVKWFSEAKTHLVRENVIFPINGKCVDSSLIN